MGSDSVMQIGSRGSEVMELQCWYRSVAKGAAMKSIIIQDLKMIK